jgi:hypothetical protein
MIRFNKKQIARFHTFKFFNYLLSNLLNKSYPEIQLRNQYNHDFLIRISYPIFLPTDACDGISDGDSDGVELLPVVKFLLRVTPRIHHLFAVTVKGNVHLKKTS